MAGIDNLTPFTKENAAEIGARGGAAKKGSKHLSTWIQELMDDENFEALIPDTKKGYIEYKGAPAKAIVQVGLFRAVAGDTKWAEWLGKYGYGLKQEVDITTNGENVNTVDANMLTQFLMNVNDNTKR